MSDKGVDLIVYLLLTLGASAIGWFKASKEKKAKNTPPEFHLPEEEHDDLDDEIVVISQEPEIPSPEPVFAPISNSDELVERAGREINMKNVMPCLSNYNNQEEDGLRKRWPSLKMTKSLTSNQIIQPRNLLTSIYVRPSFPARY